MNITINKFLIYIFSILILVFLILYDPRSDIIAEPFDINLMIINIALSYLVYDIDGFIGLHDVFERLKEISPEKYMSRYYAKLGGFLFDFQNLEVIKEHNKLIENKIFESANLITLSENKIYLGAIELGYLFYVILSFLLFGISVKSITILFLIIIIFSSFLFMINFYKNNLYFFLLQTIVFSLIIAIIVNYGASIQITSLTNHRFVSILCIIPVLHLSLAFLNTNNLTFKTFLLASFQLSLLIFLCISRATGIWSFLFLFLFYLLWIFKIGLKSFGRYKLNIFSMITTIALFIMIYNLSNVLIYHHLADEYKQDKNSIIKHPIWHPMVAGMAMNVKIHEKYVCSDTKLEDIIGVNNRPCKDYPFQFSGKPELIKYIVYYQARDNFAFQAALRYLNDNNIDEQLGVIQKNLLYQKSLNWPRYEEILKKVYFEILINEPQEFLYMHLIVKPLKFLFELVKFVFYFFNSFKINFIFISLIFMASLFVQFFCITKIKINKELIDIRNSNFKYLIETILILMFLAAGSNSIIFYPAAQSTIPECFAILITLIVFYLIRKLNKYLI